MPKKDVLEELSYSLSEKERLTLLERINKSIDVHPEDDEVSTAAQSKKEREFFIENELKSIGWFRKFFMLIRSRVSGKMIGDILIEQKMKKIKKSISKKKPGITGFESRNLTPEFGEKVFELYSRTFDFRDIYRKLWLEPGMYESCCLYIIRAMFENTKNELDEFINIEELVDLYAESGKKDIIVNEVNSRIREYVTSIPEIIYDEIERGIAPMYNLKDLILYPYTSFFQKFSFTPNRSDGGKHFFKNASAMLCLDHLKNFYIAVMSASTLDEHIPLNKFLVEFIRDIDETDPLPENYDEILKALIVNTKAFAATMPLLEIMQYFRKEPYLKIEYTFERKSFKEFYMEILHHRMRDAVNKVYADIQREYIEREIGRIFKNKKFQEFRNYRKYASIDHQKMGLPFFTHTKSLNVLHNYIRSFYQSHFADVISILEKGILSQNRITRDRLLTFSVALQELEDKIETSDKTLSPTEDDGKVFHKLRMTLISDSAQQRMYKTLVINKNREVKSLIDWGEEALSGMERIFEELVKSESNVIKVQLNKHYLLNGKSITLVSLLKKRAAHIRDFRRLMAQIIKMESE